LYSNILFPPLANISLTLQRSYSILFYPPLDRSLKSINDARKIKNDNFAIKIRENKAYMRAFNLLFFPMKLHCFQALFVNYQEHGIKPEEKALADGTSFLLFLDS
jgi:hypothetical protein